MSEFVSSLQAGEIIPQCGTTLDVIADSMFDIWISDQQISADDCRVVEIVAEENGLFRVTLSLAAGDRLKVGDR